MIQARRLAALLPLLCAFIPARAASPLDLDAGLRAAIHDDNYKLGVGGELGAVSPATPVWDLGLHLNYTHFTSKVPEAIGDVDEWGGYVTAYFKPAIDQGFSLRLGPHVGYAKIGSSYLDVGGDVMAVFKATPVLSFYGAFIPSWMVGSGGQALVRIGLGLEYNTGK
ncbi:MAG TPA: hypothetical protein VJ385_15215 [Fibrobacteria bacterium]|nr:hypothetical protein [Fibrobacteria bacterium]